ncbi:MAG: branched-chain amino acid ABC transporter permease [Clostridia bacterium]|nr:branched-chain amino acid ABC transporter permease [Clostridia bacterium]
MEKKLKSRFNLLENVYINYILIGILFLIAIPLNQAGIIGGSVLITLGSVILYSVVGIGMNILLGYAGLITLGGAGFMGLAAYLSAYFTRDLNMPFLFSLIFSVGIPIIIGIGIGLISLRLGGYYLAIATLGIGEVLKQVFIEYDVFTGGFSGKSAGYINLFGLQFDRIGTYALYAVILIFALIIGHNIVNSATGRAFMTMRSSEAAAQAMGIRMLKYKVLAFVIATIYSTIGGIMYMHLIKFSFPTTWGLGMSLNFLSIVVIGGMKAIAGPVVGALFVIAFPDLVLKNIPIIGTSPGVAYIFNGVLIVVVLLFYNRGLIKIFTDAKVLIKKLIGGK